MLLSKEKEMPVQSNRWNEPLWVLTLIVPVFFSAFSIPDLFVIIVRLWEAGWKGRYYQNKFQLSENDEGYDDFRKKVVRLYTCTSWYIFHCMNLLSQIYKLTQNI